jgi:hypothetical protein
MNFSFFLLAEQCIRVMLETALLDIPEDAA